MSSVLQRLRDRRVVWAINIALVLLATWFIFGTVEQNWTDMRSRAIAVDLKRLLTAFVAIHVYWAYQISLWRRIMEQLGSPLSWLAAAHMFLVNNLLAYIPGKVANLVGTSMAASRQGARPLHAGATVVLFQIYALISGTGVVGLLALVSVARVDALLPDAVLPILILAALTGMLLLSPKLADQVFVLVERLTGRDIGRVSLSYGQHLNNLVLYALGWFVFGGAMWLLISAFGEPISLVAWFYITAVTVASYLLGLLVVTLPGGIGITESGLVYGYLKLFPASQALAGAAFFRLGFLLATLTSLILVGLAQRALSRGRT